MPYTSLIAAIEGKINDEEDPKDKNSKPEKKIDNIIAQHLEKEFEPKGDMPLISFLIDEKELLNQIQELKQVYTQVAFSKVSKDKNLVQKI